MDFDQFLASAWRDHGDDAQGVALRLQQGPGLLAQSSQVLPLTRIVLHVFAEHLGQWAACGAALDAIAALPQAQGDAAAEAALRVARQALALAQGATGDCALAPAQQIAALCSASAISSGRADLDGAARHFEAALALAHGSNADPAGFQRALAVCAHNLACVLGDCAQRTPQQTGQMLHAARTSRVWWQRAGTWLEVQRAEYALARSHVRAGDAAQALVHARACLDICQANAAPDFELFFAHEALAVVAAALRDSALRMSAGAAARAAHARLGAGEQQACAAELKALATA